MEKAKCRACGCTDDDCRQCIKRTGEPCSWMEDDLCSACYPIVNFNFDDASQDEVCAYIKELSDVIDSVVGTLRAIAIRRRAYARKFL